MGLCDEAVARGLRQIGGRGCCQQGAGVVTHGNDLPTLQGDQGCLLSKKQALPPPVNSELVSDPQQQDASHLGNGIGWPRTNPTDPELCQGFGIKRRFDQGLGKRGRQRVGSRK